MSETLTSTPGFPTIDSYQEWVRMNWVHPHGTDEAQQHTRKKLNEESTELGEALESGDREKILEELGDFLWTNTATADNAGITLLDALQYEFPYFLDEGRSATFKDLEKYFVESEIHFTMGELVWGLDGYASQIGASAMNYHRNKSLLSEQFMTTGQPADFGDAWIGIIKAGRAKEALAQILLGASYIAHKYLDTSLEQVLVANRTKLDGRLSRGEPITKIPS